MSAILDPPSIALLAGVDPGRSAAIEESLLRGETTELRAVATIDDAVTAVTDDRSVACVVTASELPDGSGPDLCRAVRRVDENLPVVLLGDGDDAALLRESLDAGVTDLLPESAEGSRLRSAVDDAIATYRRRRLTREESDLFTAMLESLGKSIYVKDANARSLYHAHVGGGPDPEAARGKTDIELYGDKENTRQAMQDDLNVLDGQKVVDREERIPDDDVWMRTTKVPWRGDDGEVKGILGHTVDVTEYKRTERYLEELRRRFASFTGQIRHDIKTRLQVAHGQLDAIERGTGDVTELDQTLEQIDQIVEDYDGYAKRSFSLGPGQTATDLRAIAEDVRDRLDAGEIAVVVDVDPGTYVNAPVSLVRTVLGSLLRDALGTVSDGNTVRVGTTDDGFFVEESGGELPEFKRAVVESEEYTTTQDGNGRELRIARDQMDCHVWSLSLGESPEGGPRVTVDNCLADVETDSAELNQGRAPLDRRTAIGELESEPTATYDANTNQWHVTADGDDVFRQDNDFYFVHTVVEGDVSIQARVREVEYVADLSKGGVMIRDSPADDAAYGYVGKTPAFGTELLWRLEPGDDGQSRQLREHATLFDWYRIDRVGDELRMLVSIDGTHWQTINRCRTAVEDPVDVGLVVCSTVSGEPCEAVFEDVVVRSLDDRSRDD